MRFDFSLRSVGGLAFMIVFWAGGNALAQNVATGEIRGTVMDQTGAVVPGVKVAVLNTQTGVQTRVTTNSSGVYDATFLVPGPYRITFAKSGFRTFVRSGVVLGVQVITVDARLKVGEISQRVTVKESAPLVQTEQSKRSSTLTSEAISQIPNVGESWYNLTALMPGVSGGGTQNANGEGVGVNGGSAYENNFLVNGGTFTNPISQNVPGNMQGLGGIQEVVLDTHNFSAEYGNGVAVFNVITKSGTNRFHARCLNTTKMTLFQPETTLLMVCPLCGGTTMGARLEGQSSGTRPFSFSTSNACPEFLIGSLGTPIQL